MRLFDGISSNDESFDIPCHLSAKHFIVFQQLMEKAFARVVAGRLRRISSPRIKKAGVLLRGHFLEPCTRLQEN